MPERPQVGALVRDTATGRVGVFMGDQSGRWYLRPVGGGVEWSAHPAKVEPVSQREALSAKLAAANRHSVTFGSGA